MTTAVRDAVAELLGTFDVAELEPFLDRARALYHPEVHFRDPMQERFGVDGFLAMNRGLAKTARKVRFDVRDRAGDDALFYLRWSMTMQPKVGPSIAVEGVSHCRCRDGLVAEHFDYWDLGELFASAVPGGRRILRALFRPFV